MTKCNKIKYLTLVNLGGWLLTLTLVVYMQLTVLSPLNQDHFTFADNSTEVLLEHELDIQDLHNEMLEVIQRNKDMVKYIQMLRQGLGPAFIQMQQNDELLLKRIEALEKSIKA